MAGAFDRLSRREKVLIFIMAGLTVVLGLVFVQVAIAGSVSELEESIASDRAALENIYHLADSYRARTAQTQQMQSIAEENRKAAESLVTTITNVGSKVKYEAVSIRTGLSEGTKRLSDVLDFKGVKKVWLSKPKKKRRAKDKKEADTHGYHRWDQEVSIQQQIPFDALYDFFEQIEENSENKLLFITNLNIGRSRADGDRAKKPVTMTISTFFYQPKEDTP